MTVTTKVFCRGCFKWRAPAMFDSTSLRCFVCLQRIKRFKTRTPSPAKERIIRALYTSGKTARYILRGTQ